MEGRDRIELKVAGGWHGGGWEVDGGVALQVLVGGGEIGGNGDEMWWCRQQQQKLKQQLRLQRITKNRRKDKKSRAMYTRSTPISLQTFIDHRRNKRKPREMKKKKRVHDFMIILRRVSQPPCPSISPSTRVSGKENNFPEVVLEQTYERGEREV